VRNRSSIRKQGISKGIPGKIIPSLQGVIENSDYHLILAFKVNNSTKEIMVEMFDPVMKTDFKLVCIEKAIDFLQVVKCKINCTPKEEVRQFMNQKGINPEDIDTFLHEKMPDIKKDIDFIIETIIDYFKDIPHTIKILAGNNSLMLLIMSDHVLAKSKFNKFTFEFWQRYHHEILKPKIGNFEFSIQLR